MVLVSGLQIMQLGIPWKSLRGPYSINRDCCYVDHRRLHRHQAKQDRAMRDFERSPEGVRKRLDEAKLLREWEIEDAARRFLRRVLTSNDAAEKHG